MRTFVYTDCLPVEYPGLGVLTPDVSFSVDDAAATELARHPLMREILPEPEPEPKAKAPRKSDGDAAPLDTAKE